MEGARQQACAKTVSTNRNVKIENAAHGLDMRYPRKSCGFGIESLEVGAGPAEYQDSARKRRSPFQLHAPGRHASATWLYSYPTSCDFPIIQAACPPSPT